jgi:hypothetical protein
MRPFLVPAAVFFLACAPAVLADAGADAAYIADRIVTEKYKAKAGAHTRELLARKIAAALKARSVRTRDVGTLAGLLPDALVEPVVARLETRAAEHLLRTFAPEQLEAVAGRLRSLPPGESLFEASQDDGAAESVLIEDLPMLIERGGQQFLEDVPLFHAMIGLIFVMTVEADRLEVDLTAPYMAELLAAEGVFDFPNRVYRKEMLREVQAANR